MNHKSEAPSDNEKNKTEYNDNPNSPFSREIPDLLERHYQEHIRGSGISIEVAKERGYESILGQKKLEDKGFSKLQRRTSGLLLPIHAPDGSIPLCQFRPDNPRENGQGKTVKYETPANSKMRVDVPPRCKEKLKDPNNPIYLTEGIKKGDALASRGVCAISLLGVWNFKGKNEFGGTTLLADLDYIAWDYRQVYIVFDSDIMTKLQVKLALERLTEHIKRKSANVFHVYLPQASGTKVGVDDYLLTHSIDELLSLARPAEAETKYQQSSNEAKQKVFTTAFLQEGEWLVELIKNGASTSFLLFNTTSGELAINAQVQREDGTQLVPPEKNLIERGIVLLPTGVEEYENENSLFHEVRAFINRYVELGDFLSIAGLYVLLSWLYDKFSEVPYVRFMGDYGTGKSRALVVLGGICYKPFFTFGASTVSPIFRLLDAFRGTMVLDEGDHKDSGMWNELTKILNTGFQANIPLLRTEGDRKKEVKAYHVFGPKLIATRRPFHDDALESRCLTKVMSAGERRADIPINLPRKFSTEAENLRNKLLLFRLRNYSITEIDETAYIPNIEDRLNQIFTPLLSMAKGGFRALLERFSKTLQEKVFEARSQSLEGMVVRALADLLEEEEITVKRVSERLAELGLEVSPQKAGRVVRGLGIETKRSTKLKGAPYIVKTEKGQLKSLTKRYGITAESYESYEGYEKK